LSPSRTFETVMWKRRKKDIQINRSQETLEEGENTVDEGENTSVKVVENNVGEGYSEHQAQNKKTQ
jgi:hypothetical protein